jgi:hypothetical protein
VIIHLCSGPIPDRGKRAEFASCLLSVFSTRWRELYWLALIGISFWIEQEDPRFSCFDVFWGNDTPFSLHFPSLFSEADVDIILSLLRLVASVLRRGECVPGLPIPVIVELLRWSSAVLPAIASRE